MHTCKCKSCSHSQLATTSSYLVTCLLAREVAREYHGPANSCWDGTPSHHPAPRFVKHSCGLRWARGTRMMIMVLM